MKSKDLFEDNVNVGGSTSNSQFFKTYDETKNWLDEMEIENYKINKDTLIVDVDGSVRLDGKDLTELRVKFGNIRHFFYINGNHKLESMSGCPTSCDTIMCQKTNIRNFNGVGSPNVIVAHTLKNLRSFDGLPTTISRLSLVGSCHNVNSLDHFPRRITDILRIDQDFKFIHSLHRNVDQLNGIVLYGDIMKYSNILNLLYVPGLNTISSYKNNVPTDILMSEIVRQPDPRKRNLLKVAQELSNAGYHHLTV